MIVAPSRRLCRGGSLLAVLAALACGSSLHEVPRGPHDVALAQAVVVSSAPPPAKVEQIPMSPRAQCAWQDGQWLWVAQHWEWRPGSWVLPAAGCHYADPIMTWAQAAQRGVLYYTHGAWYPDRPGEPCAQVQSCLAPTQGSE